MEIIVEPNRFRQILNTGLIGGSIESTTGYFRQDGLYLEDNSLQTVGVKTFFPVHYFINYKIDGEEEQIALTKTMLEPFKFNEAFEKEQLKVTTKNGKVYYQTVVKEEQEEEIWKDDLGTPNEAKFKFQIPMTEKGFIPTGKPELVQVLLRISQLKIHIADRYKFICDGQKIKVEVTEPGVYSRELKLSKQPKLSELTLAVPGETLETIVGLLTGEVWLTFFKSALIISQKTKEGTLTYLLSPFSEA
jgi:hypothetical protein